MMTCGEGMGRRARTGRCVPPLFCLGGADSPAVVRRKVFTPHKSRESQQLPVKLAGYNEKTVGDCEGPRRSKGARRASTHRDKSGRPPTALRRARSELLARPEIVLLSEPVYTDIGCGSTTTGYDESSDPVYDVPDAVPRVAKVTRLRRSASVVADSATWAESDGWEQRTDNHTRCNSEMWIQNMERNNNSDRATKLNRWTQRTESNINRAITRTNSYGCALNIEHNNNNETKCRTGAKNKVKNKEKCSKFGRSFSCVATKDLWYNKLSQVITEERDKEPPSTTIQVTYFDPVNNIDFVSIPPPDIVYTLQMYALYIAQLA